MSDQCPKCGAPRTPGPECGQCGVIYAKAEQQEYQRKRQERAEASGQNPPPIDPPTGQSYSIDCAACKLADGMEKRRVNRFPLFIRLIGLIIATPSAVGMMAGVFVMFGQGGFGIDGGVTLVSLVFIATSAVFGLVGWLLLMRKKAWVCGRCGYMIDRA